MNTKCLSSIFFSECMSKTESILSIMIYVIYGAAYSPLTIYLLMALMTVVLHFIIISNRKDESLCLGNMYHCLELGHKAMMCPVCHDMYLWMDTYIHCGLPWHLYITRYGWGIFCIYTLSVRFGFCRYERSLSVPPEPSGSLKRVCWYIRTWAVNLISW